VVDQVGLKQLCFTLRFWAFSRKTTERVVGIVGSTNPVSFYTMIHHLSGQKTPKKLNALLSHREDTGFR
jgi:hypothetical protein